MATIGRSAYAEDVKCGGGKTIGGVRKQHMVHNDYPPKMQIDAQTYTVRADGQLLT